MNRIYRLVFNPALGQVQVAAETTRAPRRGGRGDARVRRLAPSVLAAALLLATGVHAQTLPQGFAPVNQTANMTSANGQMTVTQSGQSSLINWSSFNIGSSNSVTFQMPGRTAASINLVGGSTASIIAGSLVSNGQVFLINPSGVTFTSTATVNVGGLVASTLSPSGLGLPADGSALPPSFTLAGINDTGVVTNNGNLQATNGSISLIGAGVVNTGFIAAPTINLVVARAVQANLEQALPGADNAWGFTTTAATTGLPVGLASALTNSGSLYGNQVTLQAHTTNGLASYGINASGVIVASEVDGVSGRLTVRSNQAVAVGGALRGNNVAIAGASLDGVAGSIQADSLTLSSVGAVRLANDISAGTTDIQATSVSQRVNTQVGSLAGAVQLNTTGAVTLDSTSNAITGIGGVVGGSLALTSYRNVANNGALSVAGDTTLVGTALPGGALANWALTNSGNTFSGTLAASGGSIDLVSAGTLRLGRIDGTALTVQAGLIGLGDQVTTRNGQTYTGNVQLTNAVRLGSLDGGDIAFGGNVDGTYDLAVDTAGQTRFLGAVGSAAALRSLTTDAPGSTLLAGPVQALGNVTFNDAVRLAGDASITSTAGGVHFASTVDSEGGARALRVNAAGMIEFGSTVGSTAALRELQTTSLVNRLGGNITTTGDLLLGAGVNLAANSTLRSTGGGQVVVGGQVYGGHAFGVLTDGNVRVDGDIDATSVNIRANTFTGRAISSAGALTLDSTGALIQSGAYTALGTASFSSLGDINLSNANNRFAGRVDLDGVNVTLRNTQATLLGAVDARNLTVDSGGTISQAPGAAISASNKATFTANGDVTLSGAGNNIGNDLSVSGWNVAVRDVDRLRFGTLNAASLVATAPIIQLPTTLSTLGLQSYQGAAELQGATTLTSTLGQIYFNGSVDGGYRLTLNADAGVVFNGIVGGREALAALFTRGATATSIANNITTIGDLDLGTTTLSAGNIALRSIAGAVQVHGTLDGAAAGTRLSINGYYGVNLTGAAGGSYAFDTLHLDGSTVLTQAITTGALGIVSAGGHSQGGAYTVTGAARFNIGGDLTLDNTANRFGGPVSLDAGVARIQSSGALHLDGVDVGSLEARSDGELSVTNARVDGLATLQGGALALAALDAGSLIAGAAQGGITQTGAVRIDGDSRFTASGDITLDHADNRLTGNVTLSGADIAIRDAQALRLASVTATSLRATAPLLQLPALMTTQGLQQYDGNVLLVQNTGLHSSGGNITFNGAVDGRYALQASTPGGVYFNGVVGGTTALAALDTGNATLTTLGGNLTSEGDIVLGNTRIGVPTAVLESRSGAIDIAGTLQGGTPTQGSLTLRAQRGLNLHGGASDLHDLALLGGSVTTAAIAVGNRLDITSGSAFTQGGAYIVGGDATFTAAGDLTLNNAANRFDGTVSLDAEVARIQASGALRLEGVDVSGLDARSDAALSVANARVNGLAALQGASVALDALDAGTLTARAAQGDITQSGAVLITGDSSFTASGDITLDRADNRLAGEVTLSGAEVTLRDAQSLRLASVTANSLRVTAPQLQLPALLTTQGRQQYNGNVVLARNTTLQSTTADITFNGAVDGAYALQASTPGGVAFNGVVGGTTALAALDTRGAMLTTLGGNVTSDGDIALGNTRIGMSAVVVESGNGALDIAGTLQGSGYTQGSLTLRARHGLTLQGDASNLHDLALHGGQVSTAAIALGNRLDITSGSSFAQGGAYTVGGDAAFNAAGDLTLDNAANRFGGQVALSGEQVQIVSAADLELGAVTALGLTARTDGALSLDNAHVDGNASVQGASVLLGPVQVGGALHATAVQGGITQRGAVVAGDDSRFSARDDITLDRTDNVWGARLQADGNHLTLRTGDALDIAQLNARGAATLAGNGVHLGTVGVDAGLQVDSSAGITQSGAVRVGADSRFSAQGDVRLDNPGNRFGGGVALQGRQVHIASADDLLLDEVRATGDFSATAHGGGIGQRAALWVGGRSDIAALDEVALNEAGNRFGGPVAVQGQAIGLRAAGDLDVERLRNGSDGGVVLVAGGNLQLGADPINTGRADLLLAANGGQLRTNAALSGGRVTLAGRDGVVFGGDVSAADRLLLSSTNADIVQTAGRLQVGGATTVAAGSGRIALEAAGNAFGGALTLAGGDIGVAGGALQLGDVTATGTLRLTSTGSITQGGAVRVAGDSGMQAAGDITLDLRDNRFGGALALQGRQVTLASDGALRLAQVNAGTLQASSGDALTLAQASIAGDARLSAAQVDLGQTDVGGHLQVDGSRGITQHGALNVAGDTRLGSRGSVVLTNGDNRFGGTVDVAGNGIALTSAGDLRIARLDNSAGAGPGPAAAGGAVQLQAGGTLVLPETAIDTGGADLLLASGGQLQTRAALRGGNVSLSGRQGLQLGHDVQAAGTLALVSGAAITQTGGVLSAARLQGRAVGAAQLTGANRIAQLGDFSADGLSLATEGGLQVVGNVQGGRRAQLETRGGDLLIDASVQAGDVRLVSAGAITAGNGGRLVADTLSGRAAGPTRLGEADRFVANQIGTLGDFQSQAGFSLTNARTLTLGSLNGSAYSVDAGMAAFFLKVDGGDLRQAGATPVLAGTSHWWSSSGIGTSDAPIYLTSAAPRHVIDFVGRPPAYFYAIDPQGVPLMIGGALNIPTAILASRAQSGVLTRVAYVDMGALNATYRAFGVVQPGIRLPAGQAPTCDSGDPDAECSQ
ncbi:filamentous hemagglutinin N-terminal domain-containing protein [Bacillus subtilis subsp. subtilis]|nr:filamentous hemagglutinin N-terminal domain-containing protein [Bacillus subtilis subsp. subtilis]